MSKKTRDRRCRILQGAIVFILLSLIFLYVLVWYMATSRPKNESELYGAYIPYYRISLWDVLFKEPIAKEKLILKNDGTFEQEVTLEAATKTDIGKGTWEYDSESGCVMFDENFMTVIDIYGELDPSYAEHKEGIAFLPASKYFGCVLVGSDEAVLYRKID